MREIAFLMESWKFVKSDVGVEGAVQASGEMVNLPHTWNAEDGQDGGNDYYRGVCWYVKEFDRPSYGEMDEVWLEFSGVAMRARVYLNGKLLKCHEGGYSTFRVNLTRMLRDKNILAVSADNSENREVYPQKADFTFYGGIYRDVKMLILPKAHFALNYYGGSGIRITPEIVDSQGNPVSEEEMEQSPGGKWDVSVSVEAWTEGAADGSLVEFEVLDADGKTVAGMQVSIRDNYAKTKLLLFDARLWNGRKDPYQYTLRAKLWVLGVGFPERRELSPLRCRASSGQMGLGQCPDHGNA